MRIFGLLICLLTIGSNYAQDTVTVQTFTYDTISTRRAIFTFPAELQGETFEKVLKGFQSLKKVFKPLARGGSKSFIFF